MTLNENPLNIVKSLIKALDIRISNTSIGNGLINHPNYPSMLAVSDVLNSWNIPHRSLRINKLTFDPTKYPYPMVVHTSINGGAFLLIREIKDNNVVFTDGVNGNKDMGIGSLLDVWDGVTLFAKKDTASGEEDFFQNYVKGIIQKVRLPMVGTLAIIFLIFSLFQNSEFSWIIGAVFLIKLIGAITSILLIAHSIDKENPFTKNLCSLGTANGCNAILKSDAAKVFTWLSWSEVGLFYFMGSLLSIVFLPKIFPVLAILNLCCLPYTTYSIGYQIKAKSYCVLCCTVQAILWVEAILFFISDTHYQIEISSLTLIEGIFCFFLPLAIWVFLKPYFVLSEQTNELKSQLNRFKYNDGIYNQVLYNQPYHNMSDDVQPIILGNPFQKTIISIVSNPFCKPCAIAHKVLDDLINLRPDLTVKMIILSAESEEDKKTKVARHMTALSKTVDSKVMVNALNDWYSQPLKNYEKWSQKYPVDMDDEINDIVGRQKQWCDEVKITETPTFFINGYELPEPYSFEDLRYLIE